MQMREMPDLIDEHRATGTAGGGPTSDTGRIHEVVEDQLPAPIEKIDELCCPTRPLKGVVLRNFDHGPPPALRSEGVVSPHEGLFPGDDLFVRSLPLRWRNDGREVRGLLC